MSINKTKRLVKKATRENRIVFVAARLDVKSLLLLLLLQRIIIAVVVFVASPL